MGAKPAATANISLSSVNDPDQIAEKAALRCGTAFALCGLFLGVSDDCDE